MSLKLFKYYGIYPIYCWFIKIHCDSCGYEGRAGINWYKYVFFFLCTVFVTYTFIFHGLEFYGSLINKSRITSTYLIYSAYLGYFFRPQKYHCPNCKGDHGIPLSFYRYLKSSL